MQRSLTQVDGRTKFLAGFAILTLVFGWIGSLILPAWINSSGLNFLTAFATFLGAMAGALVLLVASRQVQHPLTQSLIGAVVVTIVTAMLYGAFQQAYSAAWAFVFFGAFVATLISRRLFKKTLE